MKANLVCVLLALTTGAIISREAAAQTPATSAETNAAAPASATPKLSAEELEKLVMPIALHPDQLIAIILPASVYPLEIVQAARFVKDTNNIPKVDDQPWDDNVKELAKFPDMIAKMDADLPWTMQLGDAFLNQPKELMDTIQSLRGKAQKAGTLQTTPQQIVTVTNIVVYETNINNVTTVTKEVVQVQPSNPQVVYVPTYPPTVYYPPPAYSPYAPLVTFGVGMAWGAILANNCNWGGGDVDVDVNRNVNRNTTRNTNRSTTQRSGTQRSGTQSAGTQKWQPDKNRMSKSGTQSVQNRDSRGWGGSGQSGKAGAGGGAGNRSSQMASTRGAGAGQGQRPSASSQQARSPGGGQASANRASPSANSRASSANRSGGQRSGGGSAFSGSSSGSKSRSYSNRGASSRGGGGGGGGGRGGGGRRR
jgi:hypothetical protein